MAINSLDSAPLLDNSKCLSTICDYWNDPKDYVSTIGILTPIFQRVQFFRELVYSSEIEEEIREKRIPENVRRTVGRMREEFSNILNVSRSLESNSLFIEPSCTSVFYKTVCSKSKILCLKSGRVILLSPDLVQHGILQGVDFFSGEVCLRIKNSLSPFADRGNVARHTLRLHHSSEAALMRSDFDFSDRHLGMITDVFSKSREGIVTGFVHTTSRVTSLVSDYLESWGERAALMECAALFEEEIVDPALILKGNQVTEKQIKTLYAELVKNGNKWQEELGKERACIEKEVEGLTAVLFRSGAVILFTEVFLSQGTLKIATLAINIFDAKQFVKLQYKDPLDAFKKVSFNKEAELSKILNGVTACLQTLENNHEKCYMVAERFSLTTFELRSRLQENYQKLSLKELYHIGIKMIRGLMEIHQRGFILVDCNSGNVMYQEDPFTGKVSDVEFIDFQYWKKKESEPERRGNIRECGDQLQALYEIGRDFRARMATRVQKKEFVDEPVPDFIELMQYSKESLGKILQIAEKDFAKL